MQYSIRTLLVAITLVACILVIPTPLSAMLTQVIWLVLPGLFLTLLRHGSEPYRTFAAGALATYAAMALLKLPVDPFLGSSLISFLMGMCIMAFSGGACILLRRRLESNSRDKQA
jgi:hypothetical protein